MYIVDCVFAIDNLVMGRIGTLAATHDVVTDQCVYIDLESGSSKGPTQQMHIHHNVYRRAQCSSDLNTRSKRRITMTGHASVIAKVLLHLQIKQVTVK